MLLDSQGAPLFVGREWLLKKLEEACAKREGGSAVVLVLGDPGAGKSAVMTKVLDRYRSDHRMMQVCC